MRVLQVFQIAANLSVLINHVLSSKIGEWDEMGADRVLEKRGILIRHSVREPALHENQQASHDGNCKAPYATHSASNE